MKNLALALVTLCTICLSTEVSAQARKVTTVTKSSLKPQKSNEDLTLSEINKRMNAVNDELENRTSKKSEKVNYCYLTEQLINVANDYQRIRYQRGGM